MHKPSSGGPDMPSASCLRGAVHEDRLPRSGRSRARRRASVNRRREAEPAAPAGDVCGPRAVVLAHQGASDLCIWLPYARTLAARGYRVVVFDHRGFGSSGRASRATRKDRVDYDVLGAIATVRRRGATSVVLGGASLGGAAVLSAAALATPAVHGVI